MSEYIFTFGFGQKHENCFVTIEAEDAEAAREVMVAHFGKEWAFQYPDREIAGVDLWDYTELDLNGEPIKDNCSICHGEKGGVPGNENMIDGKLICDYCHAEKTKDER